VKVGFFQFAPRFKDKEANLIQIERVLETTEFDLLVLPELSITGYAFGSRDELLPFAESIPGPTTERLISRLGERILILGLAMVEDDNLYNVAVALTQQKIHIYEKVHLFRKEKEIFTPGRTGFSVFDYCGFKIGLMICFDWIYPEAARSLALHGADIIAHPSNLVLPYCQDAMVTRSLENRVFIITANRIGVEREYRFTGKSQITGPEGEVLIRVGEEEVVKVIEIDPGRSREKRITPENDLFQDRRPELYFSDLQLPENRRLR